MKARTCLALLGAFLLASPSAFAQDADCMGSNTFGDVQCLGKELSALDTQLEALYQATLQKLPPSPEIQDRRKSREQLERAQAAWKTFRDEHCNFIGGIQGGSSLWVTRFATECAIVETKLRIGFFQNVPWGGH